MLEVLGLLVGGGVLTTVITALINQGRPKAELSELFAKTAKELVEASNAHYDEIQEQMTQFREDKAALICEVGRLDGLIDQLKKENAIKDDEADAMRIEIQQLQRKLDSKDQKIEDLEAENDLLRERVSELERQLKELLNKGKDK